MRKYTHITIRGMVYATTAAAAQAAGVSPSEIRRRMRNGTLDLIGTGRVASMPIRIRGVDYEDAKEAAKAFGVTVSAVRQALYKNRLDKVGIPRSQFTRSPKAKPITIGGVRYPSMSAASRALGMGREYVSHALVRGRAELVMAKAMKVAA